MKIAIITFHFARNYGAVLQCYALQEWLASQGHEVNVLDYRPKTVEKGYRWLDIRRFWGRTPARFLRKTSTELRVIGDRKRRYDAFEKFIRTRLNLAAPGEGQYDLIICGSDQIWNQRLTDGPDPVYWGIESKNWGRRIVSYAASLENGLLQTGPAEIDFLKGFDAVSVREESAASVLKEMGLTVTTCCDPVMLLERKDWENLAAKSSLSRKNYLLLYQVRYSERMYRHAETLAKEKSLELVVLSAKVEMQNSKGMGTASPEDFVRLIMDADYIVTSSFHGTALSLVLGKEFESVLFGDGRDSRAAGLLALRDSGRLGEFIQKSKEYLLTNCI